MKPPKDLRAVVDIVKVLGKSERIHAGNHYKRRMTFVGDYQTVLGCTFGKIDDDFGLNIKPKT